MLLTLSTTTAPLEAISHEGMGSWIAGLIVVLIAGDLIWRAIDRLRPNPPLHNVYATRKEHDQLARAVVDLDAKTDRRFGEAAYASSQGREKIYTSIRALEGTTASLAADNRTHSLQLDRLESKLDRVIENKR